MTSKGQFVHDKEAMAAIALLVRKGYTVEQVLEGLGLNSPDTPSDRKAARDYGGPKFTKKAAKARRKARGDAAMRARAEDGGDPESL